MIDPSSQAKRRIELLKKEREKYDLNMQKWFDITIEIGILRKSIERWERMKKDGIKF